MDKFNKTALIGYTGFVGSNLYYDYKFTDCYNTKNINDIINKEYDCVIVCGINATKWYANLHPEEDIEQINSLLGILLKVKINKIILVSTIDIYDNIEKGFDENYLSSENNHPYGKNRLYAEQFIMKNFSNYHIVRLPGLFGYGLKKNIIYDYLNKSLKSMNINFTFQWYCLNDLFNDINFLLNNDIRIINLFPEPLPNKMLNQLFKKYNHNYENILIIDDSTNVVKYNCTTKYSITNYVESKETIINKLDNYINNMLNNRLTIGNLSWKHNDNMMMLTKLKDYGIKDLEIAPYKFFGKKVSEIDETQNKYFDGFNIYSFQAILFPLNENIFEVAEKRIYMTNYIKKIIDVASQMGVKILVFGSPKNRIKNELSYESTMDIAIPFFRELGDYCISKNVILCIEPNAKLYSCDFITNSKEGRDLVIKVNSEGFRLHLDVGCMFLENESIIENIEENIDILKHIHFSAPGLKSLSTNKNINYKVLFNEINKIYTNGKISIEMLNQDDYDIIKDIRDILK